MCGDLEMADGRLTTPVTLIGTQPLVAGAPSVVGHLGGDGVFYGPPLAQAGQASRGPEVGRAPPPGRRPPGQASVPRGPRPSVAYGRARATCLRPNRRRTAGGVQGGTSLPNPALPGLVRQHDGPILVGACPVVRDKPPTHVAPRALTAGGAGGERWASVRCTSAVSSAWCLARRHT